MVAKRDKNQNQNSDTTGFLFLHLSRYVDGARVGIDNLHKFNKYLATYEALKESQSSAMHWSLTALCRDVCGEASHR